MTPEARGTTAYRGTRSEGRRLAFVAMASSCEIIVSTQEAGRAQRAIDAAVSEVRRIERKYSRYREDSIVTRINRAAGGAPVELDEEAASLVDYAAACFASSGGLFDATSGVLRRAWDFRCPRLPQAHELAGLLELVGWDKVEWSRPGLRLTRPGMELDFGGFGKEYAADRAAAALAACGIAHGLVNLGGDVRVIGTRPDGRPWRIGVRHPREADRTLALIELANAALATSGDYERYFEFGGRRYCHILDPRTGMPASGMRCVSVVSPLAVLAGTHATVAMLRGTEATAYLEAQGLTYLAVAEDGSVAGALADTVTSA